MKELLDKPLPKIPTKIQKRLDTAKITLTSFEEKENILCSKELQQEVGYRQYENGDWLVSMTCPMPEITSEMIRWWFWWHCKESLRYQIWFPGAHISISYPKKDRAYFEWNTMPPFQPHSPRPVERIGGIKMPLQIDFVTPEEFGFSRETMEENDIPLIVCGHVSAFNGFVKHTEMSHMYKQTEDGLVLISRFWLGRSLKNPLLRKLLLTAKTARGMAEHCCIEYRNLVEILPELYEEYHI